MNFVRSRESLELADKEFVNIQEGGIYKGKITQVKEISVPSGAKGLEFEFECKKGNATFSLFTVSKTGEEIGFTMGIVSSLLFLLGLENVAPVTGVVREWVAEFGEFREVEGQVYPDLCRDIAVVLQAEEYITGKGVVKIRMNLKHFLHPQTLQKAKEFIDNLPAEEYKKMKYPLIKVQQQTPNLQPQQPQNTQVHLPSGQVMDYDEIAQSMGQDDDELLF